MPEAVIVSAARSPIGRANKGSLKDLRPDDLTAFIVKTALDKIPALDPNTVDDLLLGCGLPGGESGNNMGRVVNVLNGMDQVPGATITRYCASSVQTSRMAFHAIKAGEALVTSDRRPRTAYGQAGSIWQHRRVRHVYECPMRWADLDLLGHVNNVTYVDYLQEARVDMLRTHGPAAHTGELAEGVVVVRHEVTYLAPLIFQFRPVKIESWVTEIRAASFTMAYEVFHDEPDGGRRVYLRAATVLTPYVFGTERPRRLSAVERETLQAFLEPS